VKADTAIFDRIAQALTHPGQGTSDFDLNPDFKVPGDVVKRPAGVLVPLVERSGDIHVILTKRSSRLKHHPGQIAFPGGKVDPGDRDETAAALREAREEIGLPEDLVQPIGILPAHVTVTAFTVVPVIGRVMGDFDVLPEPGEVDEVFDVPLRHLLDSSNYSVQSRRWRGVQRSYYAVPWGPYYIWGATARMLRVLADRLAP
jgi:8-oxo-dGTP pyrophosphatase MutT (NUDIX family)